MYRIVTFLMLPLFLLLRIAQLSDYSAWPAIKIVMIVMLKRHAQPPGALVEFSDWPLCVVNGDGSDLLSRLSFIWKQPIGHAAS